MTVKWLAGNRIEGTSADRTTGTPAIPAVSGGWKELGRTTLGSPGDDIAVSCLADKRYYMILGDMIDCGGSGSAIRLNNDSGSNYAVRRNVNGGSDSTNTSVSCAYITDVRGNPNFNVTFLSNTAGNEKLWINQNMWRSSSGSSIAPGREEGVGKWTNTSDAVSTFTYHNWHSGNYGTCSEAVVLGWDPDDTHSCNFWTELASVNGDGSSCVLDSGTFTAKKYLWVQAFVDAPTSVNIITQVGNSTIDTGSNYSYRSSGNGGADATAASASWIAVDAGSPTVPSFMNMFIINKSASEKLFIIHQVDGNTAGAGTAPDRRETVAKWTNTSNQINRIELENQSATNFTSNSFIKVWGNN